MYSHDTFGLGHLRRSRAIAEELTRRNPAVQVTILTGAPSAAAFPKRDRIRLVRLPPVRKLPNGGYASGDETMSLADTISARQAIIDTEARQFAPHLTIVDKEPSGLDGELLLALEHLKDTGSMIILGLRDVLDAPEPLRAEWQRKRALHWIERFYDEIWIYGPSDFHDPLAGIDLCHGLRARLRFTGFIGRSNSGDHPPSVSRGGHVLVTAGGGADGYPLLSRAIAALRILQDTKAIIVAGPYMPLASFIDLQRRAAGSRNLTVIAFDPRMQDLVARSRALISMCGYNTFCEALSFDVPALYVPRTVPRREQWIRASRSQAAGWSTLLSLDETADSNRFAATIEKLSSQAPPSDSRKRPDLNGLTTISSLLAPMLWQARPPGRTSSRSEPL